MRKRDEVPSARHIQRACPVQAPCLMRIKPRIIKKALVALRPAFKEGSRERMFGFMAEDE